MSFAEQLITIAVVVLGTMTTRFLPFLLFPAKKNTTPGGFPGQSPSQRCYGAFSGLLP